MSTADLSPLAPEGNNVVSLEADRARRLKAEVERLAGLPTVEWMLYLDDTAKRHGVEPAKLEALVKTVVTEREKARRETKTEVERTAKRRERNDARAESEARRHEKESERKEKERQKEKTKAFKALIGLPSAVQDVQLATLATRIGEDLELLRAEFEVFAGEVKRDEASVEPWAEPVDTKELLGALTAHVRRYVVLDDDAVTAISLWTTFAWVYELAVHSPILIVTSAEPDSGKTTLLGVLNYLAPTPYPVVELTGAGLFHIVDHIHPTLIIDEADALFHRKPDLLHIINSGWTRGTKIPRMVRGVVRHFDPFSPKVIGMKGFTLPEALASRGIVVKLWPKTENEKVSDFPFSDTPDSETLRRKLLRWSTDNAAKLKDAAPPLPPGFNNRLGVNWKVLFAIAEHGGCLERAQRAATALSQKLRKPSEGVRLLAALRAIFAKREMLTSAELVKTLTADRDAEWCEFRGNSAITKRQVAVLLDAYGIHPGVIHPTKGTTASARGYKAEQFADAFARYLPANRTTVQRRRGE